MPPLSNVVGGEAEVGWGGRPGGEQEPSQLAPQLTVRGGSEGPGAARGVLLHPPSSAPTTLSHGLFLARRACARLRTVMKKEKGFYPPPVESV